MLAADDVAIVGESASAARPAVVDRPAPRRRRRWRSVFDGTWPKVAAVAIFVFVWQCVVWTGWRPEYVLPGPRAVAAPQLLTSGGLIADPDSGSGTINGNPNRVLREQLVDIDGQHVFRLGVKFMIGQDYIHDLGCCGTYK